MAATNLGAIIAAFDASPAFKDAEASQGAWMGVIPEQFSDQDLPFVALVHDGDIQEYTTETQYKEFCQFRFLVYDALAPAEATAKKIKAAFDKVGFAEARKAFAIDGALVFTCRRPDGKVGYKVEPIGQRRSTGELIFEVTLTYVMGIDKTL